MITDQIKLKLQLELLKQFIDDLPKVTNIDGLVKKSDDYETTRFNFKTIKRTNPYCVNIEIQNHICSLKAVTFWKRNSL